jgi:hypothetical protein
VNEADNAPGAREMSATTNAFRNGWSVTGCPWWLTCSYTWLVHSQTHGHFVSASRFSGPVTAERRSTWLLTPWRGAIRW